jgi:hypothetical protein
VLAESFCYLSRSKRLFSGKWIKMRRGKKRHSARSLLILNFQEDSRGRAGKLSGAPLVDKRSCKGAFGKTSGRSIFQNAPLRATSSALGAACRLPFANAMPMCTGRVPGQVGFALGLETFTLIYKILYFLLFGQGRDFHSQCGIWGEFGDA